MVAMEPLLYNLDILIILSVRCGWVQVKQVIMPAYPPMVVPPLPWRGVDYGAYLISPSLVMRTRGYRAQNRALYEADRQTPGMSQVRPHAGPHRSQASPQLPAGSGCMICCSRLLARRSIASNVASHVACRCTRR